MISHRFEKGMRVVASAEYRRAFRPPYEGVVTKVLADGFPEVLRDGKRSSSKYHPSFWEPLLTERVEMTEDFHS